MDFSDEAVVRLADESSTFNTDGADKVIQFFIYSPLAGDGKPTEQICSERIVIPSCKQPVVLAI